jgi:16S rRNA (guanine527-N7)-methyltransferase
MAPNPDEQIFRLAKEWAVDLAAETAARVGRFCAVLLEWNKRVNLTGARSLADLLAEHVPDSFVAARLIPENASVIDIGSGGGLPGIPLAILRADCRFKLVEPRGKRVAFLNTAVRTCGCRNVSVLQARSEELEGGGYDVAMSRATFAPEDWLQLGSELVGARGQVLVFSTAELASEATRLGEGVSYRSGQGTPRWAGLFGRA